MLKQLLCESSFISSWIIHQNRLLCRTIETDFNWKRMIPYENSLNKKLLDGNSEIHLLPWIRSRYFKSTRKDKIDISTSTIFLIRIHSHDFQLYLLLIALSVSRIAKCFQWNVTLQKSRVPKATLWWFSELYLVHNMHPIF